MDEADRILNMDFEAEVDKILRNIPRERKTYLFSATMTAKGETFIRTTYSATTVETCLLIRAKHLIWFIIHFNG